MRFSLEGLQRRQKAPVFISAVGAFISFDTSYVFVVVASGEGSSPALWEVHPGRGRTRKGQGLSPLQANKLLWGTEILLVTGTSNTGFIKLQLGAALQRDPRSTSQQQHDQPWFMNILQLFCQMCLPFVFCRSWNPSMLELSHAEGVCRRDSSWKGKPGALGMAEPLGAAWMSQQPLQPLQIQSCICSLQTVDFKDA